jgi:hypothetical protein
MHTVTKITRQHVTVTMGSFVVQSIWVVQTGYWDLVHREADEKWLEVGTSLSQRAVWFWACTEPDACCHSCPLAGCTSYHPQGTVPVALNRRNPSLPSVDHGGGARQGHSEDGHHHGANSGGAPAFAYFPLRHRPRLQAYCLMIEL